MTLFLRSGVGRIAMTVVLGALSLAVGVFAARALAEATLEGGDVRTSQADDDARESTSALIPIVAPLLEAPLEGGLLPAGSPMVRVGLDPVAGDTSLGPEITPEIIGFLEASDLDSPDADDPEGDIDEPEPMLDPSTFVSLIRPPPPYVEPRAIDPCAGSGPEDGAPISCPPGVGSTVFASHPGDWVPPNTVTVGDRPDSIPEGLPSYLGCPPGFPDPAPGETAQALWSRTPLSRAEVAYRPYGSNDPWTVVELVPAAHSENAEAWFDHYKGGASYDPAHGSDDRLTAIIMCFNVARDETVAYEVEATGDDEYGRIFSAEGIFGSVAPDQRPVTTATVDDFNRATVRAFSREAGRAAFYWSVAHGIEFLPDCTEIVEETEIESRPGVRPGPAGLVDPSFDRMWTANIDVPAGQTIHVCVEIFDTLDSAQVVAVDQLLIHSGSIIEPVVWVTGVSVLPAPGQIFDDPTAVAFREGEISIRAGEGTVCESALDLPEVRVTGDEGHQRLWSCPPDDPKILTLTLAVRPLDVPRNVFETLAIELARPACRPTSCYQPSALYRLSIPAGAADAEGHEPWPRGTVWVWVEYQVVRGTTEGRAVEYLSADDVQDSDDLAFRFDRTSLRRGDDLLSATDLTILTSHPVTVTGVTVVPYGQFQAEVDSGCVGSASEPTGEASTAETVTIEGLCPGTAYDFIIDAVDEDGAEVQARYSTRRSEPGALEEAETSGGINEDFPGPLQVPPVTVTAMVEIEYEYISAPADTIDLRLPSFWDRSTPFVWEHSTGQITSDQYLCGLQGGHWRDGGSWMARTRWPVTWSVTGSSLAFRVVTNVGYPDDDCGKDGAYPPIYYGGWSVEADIPLERIVVAEIELISKLTDEPGHPSVWTTMTVRILDVS